MYQHSFHFIPFAQPTGKLPIAIEGTISRSDQWLYIVYKLSGDHTDVQLPVPVRTPLRRDELWKETCFECFFKQSGETAYHELNVCPDGNWNLYRFDEYRNGMQEELRITELTVRSFRDANMFELSCEIPLAPLLCADRPLTLGISCVLAHTNQANSYWALRHPDSQPDFHHPGGYLLQI